MDGIDGNADDGPTETVDKADAEEGVPLGETTEKGLHVSCSPMGRHHHPPRLEPMRWAMLITRFAILLFAVVLLAAATPAIDLGYWGGLRSISGQWARGVIERTDRVADWGDRLINGLSVDAPTSRFMLELTRNMSVQNLDGIYHALPVIDGSARSIVGYGAPTRVGKGYAFTLFRTGDYPGDLDAPLGNWRGTLTLERTVAPDLKSRTLYRMEYLGNLSFGDFTYTEILGFWEEFLKAAERAARAPDISVHQREAVQAQPLLERPSDLKLWQAFAHDMPGMARFFNRFLVVQGIATPRHHPVVGNYLAVDLVWNARLSTFQAEFPALAERFEKIGRVMELQGTLRSAEGQRVATCTLKTDRATMRCQALLKDGTLLPFDLDDEPIPRARPFQLGGGRGEDMMLLVNIHVDAFGVKVDVDNLRFEIRIERGLASGGFEANLASLDRLMVTGKILGFIPMSVVNAVVPIEENTRNSIDVAMRGFGGRATRIGMGFDNPVDGKPAHWKVGVSTVTIENAFLQFVLRVTGSRFSISKREEAEMGRIVREASESLNTDYQNVRKRVGVVTEKGPASPAQSVPPWGDP
jgi:hypothetical protein